jgi:hypothetical protein
MPQTDNRTVTANPVINASTSGELRCCGTRWNGSGWVECGQLLFRFFRGFDGEVEVMCRRCKSLARAHVLFSTGRRK